MAAWNVKSKLFAKDIAQEGKRLLEVARKALQKDDQSNCELRNLQGLCKLGFEVALGCSIMNFTKVVVSKSSTSGKIKSNRDNTLNGCGVDAKSNTTSNVDVSYGIKEKE